jgi:hypothetical protein
MQTLKVEQTFSSLFQVKTLNMLANRVGTWANLVTYSNSFSTSFPWSSFYKKIGEIEVLHDEIFEFPKSSFALRYFLM